MTRVFKPSGTTGFTLVELMVALAIFLIISGMAFSLLSLSQQRYQSESQVTGSFQDARLALDQIVRDVSISGFPPANQFSVLPNDTRLYASTPFAWSSSAGYPNTPCQIGTGGGGTCSTTTDSTPGDFDLIVETNIDPQDSGSTVQWIRYQLRGTTLYRGVAQKANNADPDTSFTGVMAPFVQNVVNNTLAPPVPIFQYLCDNVNPPQAPPTILCTDPTSDHSPKSIRGVAISLIVQSPSPDPQTNLPIRVDLTGRARRINPSL